jgi:hypothetical protein
MTSFDQTSSSVEAPRQFIPTPETLSTTLHGMKMEEIAVQLKSVEGRRKLAEDLRANALEVQKQFPDFHPENIERELDIAGESLLAHEKLLREAESPERKSVLARSWETIKGFPSNHPYITTILLIALLTAGAGYLGYLPSLNFGGWWDGFKGWLGYGTGEGVTEAASEGVNAISQSGTAEAVAEGGNALSQVAPRYYEVIVNKDGYLFNGVQYAKEQLDQLNLVLHEAGVEGADSIKILRTRDSRFVPWTNLMNALEESGLSRDQILSPDSIYEPPTSDSFPFTP